MALLRRGSLAALVVAACSLSFAPGGGTARNTFPCRWNYSLYVGLHAGYVSGGESADCAGVPGTLTLTARLYRSKPGSQGWRLARSESRSWTNPTGNRYIEFSEPCTSGKTRAVFTWTLRDHGRLISDYSVTTASVNDPGRGCKYILG